MYHISEAAGILRKGWGEKLREQASAKDPWKMPGDIYEDGVGWRPFTQEEREERDAEYRYQKGEYMEVQLFALVHHNPTSVCEDRECGCLTWRDL